MYGQPMMMGQPQPVVVMQNQQPQGPGSYCPVCNTNTGSKVDYEVGSKTWIMCLVLCFFTGICCWIPFVCDDCK